MKALKNTDKVLLIVSIILFSIGLVMIFSASNVAAFMRYHKTPYDFFVRQAGSLVAGVGLFYLIIQMNTKTYSGLSWFALVISTGLLIFVFFFGPIINDARSWITLGFFNFQPSEIVKIVLIVWYAAFFELKRKKLDKLSTSVFPLVCSLSLAALIVLQPDFGTAAIIIMISFLLYFLIPVDKNIKLKVIGSFGLVLVIVLMGYYILNTSSMQRQVSRFDFRYPCSEEKFYTTGNQVCNSYIAFNNGGLLGKGLGNSTQKYLYLPEAHTDFIFSIYVEELGIIGAVVLISLYFVLLVRIIVIGKMAPTIAKKLICYGVSFYLFMHIIVNLTGVLGILPMTGVPLPFMSYGGSVCWCTLLALTMVQRISYENNSRKS